MTTATATRLTRRTAHRGQNVTVTFRDGTTRRVTLEGWGASHLRGRDRDTGAWVDTSTVLVATVVTG